MSNLPPIQLFNLAEEPGEETNLVSKHPDQVDKIGVLREIIDNGRSTPGKKLNNDVEIVMIKPLPKPQARKKKK